MVTDVIRILPPWLLAGLLLGAAATVVVAGLFYLGDRYLADPEPASSRRISGSAKRRAEIRAYLRRIEEPFAEDHPVDGGEVAFYLPEREVAVTFDPQHFFRLEDGDVYPILYEDEMPGHQLGRRLPFEVPTIEPEPDASDPVTAAFEALDLPRTADESAVRDAYRARVKEVHPDQGGDEEAFRELKDAYATALNHCEGREAAPGRRG